MDRSQSQQSRLEESRPTFRAQYSNKWPGASSAPASAASSVVSLHSTHSLPQSQTVATSGVQAKYIEIVVGSYAYSSDKPQSLNFQKGEVIYVLTKLNSGWWEGFTAAGSQGWFPSNFTQPAPTAGSTTTNTLTVPNQKPIHSATTSISTTESIDPLSRSSSFRQPSTMTTAPSEEEQWNAQTSSQDSRKHSIASCESSATGDSQPDSIKSYRFVDTRDPNYKYTASYWVPQMSSSGRLTYVNATRGHISEEIPFEKVDIVPYGIEPLTDQVAIPQDTVETRAAISQEDSRFYDKYIDPYAALSRKSRTSSSGTSLEYQGSSLETTMMVLHEFEDDEFEKTWTEVMEKLHITADNVAKAANVCDELAFSVEFINLSLIIQKISLYIGVPPGSFPSSQELVELSLSFRRMMTTLIRIGIYQSIDSMIKHAYQDQPALRCGSGMEQITIKEMVDQLVGYAVHITELFRALKQQQLSMLRRCDVELDDIIDIPPRKFDVKYFADGSWSNITVTRSGQLVCPTTSSIPGSLALLEQGYGSKDSAESLPSPPPLALETYNTAMGLDAEVIGVLELRLKMVNNILAQFIKLSSTVPTSKSIDVIQDRRKILSSSLQTLINISKVIVNIVESIDLTVFYSCRRTSLAESHITMTHLYEFLEAKQAIYDSIAEITALRNENEVANHDVLAELTARFEHAKIEDVFFTYEQSRERQIKERVLNLAAVLDRAVETTRVLSCELESMMTDENHSVGGDHATENYESRSREASTSRRSSTSSSVAARRKESATDTASIGTHSFRTEEGPWFLQLEHGDEMVYDKKGSVRGGSVRALVEQLTLHNRLVSEFNASMLLTFPSFMDANQLFELLLERFLIQPPEGLTSEEFAIWSEKKQRPIRLRVVNVLKTWLETYWFEDDSEDMTNEARNQLFEQLSKFASQLKTQKFPGAVSLANIVEKRYNNKEPSFKRYMVTITARPPLPLLPKNLKKFKLSEVEPLEMARQLCVREFKLLVVITSHECLKRGCGGHSKNPNAGGKKIGEFIRNSNSMTNWVAYAILRHSEPKRRASCIRYFVQVAEYCRSLNNFSSMTAIISALYSSTIHRMKRTWDYVSQRTVTKLENMNRLMNSSRNFNEYRDLLNLVSPPVVPFFGVYLTDLTFVEDGNPNYLDPEHKIVNFAKRMKTANIIEYIRQFQVMPYNFEEIPDVQRFLDGGFYEAPPIEELYDTSLNFEPREKPGPDRVAKLLEENGIL